ncbi:MAG: hypothetical protein IV094_11750 [Vitreoscilla sp.]|nr:hypothetical protein [Vitreoscilla sp.]
MAAKVAPSVRDAVVEAQFGQIQISAEYWPAHAKEHRRAKSHPLGMICTGLVSYLIVRFDGYLWVPVSAAHLLVSTSWSPTTRARPAEMS